MKEIELVIKLPKDKYNSIVEMYDTFPVEWREWGLEAIKNGVKLPKGHGALKDTDAILRELFWVTSRPVKSQLYMITQAQTLVEADNESKEAEANG